MLSARGEMYRTLAATAIKQSNFEVAEVILKNFAFPSASR
jgi:hypothetical protein